MKKNQQIYEPYFEPIGHIYQTPSGQIIDSVTTILKLELNLWNFGTNGAAERGAAVHYLSEDYDKGNLTESEIANISTEYLPYFNAYRQFKIDHKVKIISTEQRLYHPVFLFAGTLDRIVKMDGGKDEIILDLKTGAEEKSYAMQLAAYEELTHVSMPLPKGKRRGRMALYLRNDGTYLPPKRYDDPHDWPNFLALYSAHNVKVNLGYRKTKIKQEEEDNAN